MKFVRGSDSKADLSRWQDENTIYLVKSFSLPSVHHNKIIYVSLWNLLEFMNFGLTTFGLITEVSESDNYIVKAQYIKCFSNAASLLHIWIWKAKGNIFSFFKNWWKHCLFELSFEGMLHLIRVMGFFLLMWRSFC